MPGPSDCELLDMGAGTKLGFFRRVASVPKCCAVSPAPNFILNYVYMYITACRYILMNTTVLEGLKMALDPLKLNWLCWSVLCQFK